MRVLTRTEAHERAHSIALDEMAVHVDVRGGDAPRASTFQVRSTLSLTATTSSTFLDVAGTVTSLSVNGHVRQFHQDEERLALEDLPTGTPITITVDADYSYSRTGEGLHRYEDPEDARVYCYTQFEPQDAHRAWPCFDQPDMKARWSFTVDAPTHWIVASNGQEVSTEAIEDGVRHVFAQTLPLSSYITALVAGDWAVVDGGVWKGGAPGDQEIEVPLRLMCRSALAPSMDSEDILEVTTAGLDFFHEVYASNYPWGKYDEVFVPEYNLGAMENPGCVTFNESYLSREHPTFFERQRRANTILHEMCHMWFGDLVTPQWWDGLWLKESFAENQGAIAAARATKYAGERAAFVVGRKAWALEQDQMPTTHPIDADIPDVAAAKTNFDGITYAKGAAVLNQLVAWVGEDAFFKGARLYFTRYAYSSTRLEDLISCLEEASSHDLSGWVEAWLKTSGPAILSASWQTDLSGRVFDFTLRDEAQKPGQCPHRLEVSTWALRGGKLEKTHSFDVRMNGVEAPIDPEGILNVSGGRSHMDLVVVNDNDLTYAVPRLDSSSTELALGFISTCPDLMTRSVVWSSLWNAVRDGLLDPEKFAFSAMRCALDEEDASLAAEIVTMARSAMTSYLPSSKRAPLIHELSRTAVRLARTLSADRARPWVKAMLSLVPLAADEETLLFVRELAEHNSSQSGWLARAALAARDEASPEDIEQWFLAHPSGEAAAHRVRALAAIPRGEQREAAWQLITSPGVSNDHLSAAFEGLALSTWSGESIVGRALEVMEEFWGSHTIGLAIRFVNGSLLGGIDIENPASLNDLVEQVSQWLDSHEDAAPALRRLMIEHLDDAKRRVRVQERWA